MADDRAGAAPAAGASGDGPSRAPVATAGHNNDMSRIPNGFRLNPERGNVFMDRLRRDPEPLSPRRQTPRSDRAQ